MTTNSRKAPSRRDPRYVQQQHERAIQAMDPGSMSGRLANAGRIDGGTSGTVESYGEVGAIADLDSPEWYDDHFTLASAGAQSLALTYLPIVFSEDVKISGLGAERGVHWDRDASGQEQAVRLLTASDARVGELVTVHYQYQIGMPSKPADPLLLNIPFQADGWKYHELTSIGLLSTYVDPLYDDTGWAVGTAPLGIGSYTDVDGHPKATTVPAGNTGGLGHVEDFVVRRWLPPGTGIVVTFDETNYMDAYVNGTLLTSRSTGLPEHFTSAVADQTANWLLAVYVTVANGYTAGGVDISVSGTET